MRDAQLPNQFRCQTSLPSLSCEKARPEAEKKPAGSALEGFPDLFPDRRRPDAHENTIKPGGDLGTVNEYLVELSGIEPLTPCLQSRCSPN